MNKLMTLEVLSSIKGAESSAAIESLFDVIKKGQASADTAVFDEFSAGAVSIDDLRDDVVIESPLSERKNIIENFPGAKNNYLVVSKVIEE